MSSRTYTMHGSCDTEHGELSVTFTQREWEPVYSWNDPNPQDAYVEDMEDYEWELETENVTLTSEKEIKQFLGEEAWKSYSETALQCASEVD